MKKRLLPLLLLPCLILFTQCDKDNNGTDPNPDTNVILTIPSADRDSAYAFVKAQVDMGPRVPGSDAHKQCAKWMADKLKSYGATVTTQTFTADYHFGESHESYNVIGSFNPENRKRVLLCAHWDTRYIADQDDERENEPIDGADDGGSGVAVLLEIARQIQANPIDLGVDIVLFDAEDQGISGGDETTTNTWCIGSQYWSKNPHTRGYRARYGILLDMVGSKNARFTKEGTSMHFAPNYMNKVWKLAAQMGYAGYFQDVESDPLIDDHWFINDIAKIPTIDIINRPQNNRFGRYWHTHDDNIDVISKKTLGVVGNTVLAVIYNEDAGRF